MALHTLKKIIFHSTAQDCMTNLQKYIAFSTYKNWIRKVIYQWKATHKGKKTNNKRKSTFWNDWRCQCLIHFEIFVHLSIFTCLILSGQGAGKYVPLVLGKRHTAPVTSRIYPAAFVSITNKSKFKKKTFTNMKTQGSPQDVKQWWACKRGGPDQGRQITSKTAFTVLEQHPLDRWDKGQHVPEWWEERSKEQERMIQNIPLQLWSMVLVVS